MKRQFQTVKDGTEGTQRAQQLGLALAAVTDEETLETLVRLKGSLDQFGGEFRMIAVRPKLDTQGRQVENVKKDGEFVTVAYAFEYKHIAKIPQLPTEPDSKGEVEFKDEPLTEGDWVEEYEDPREPKVEEEIEPGDTIEVELDDDGLPVKASKK